MNKENKSSVKTTTQANSVKPSKLANPTTTSSEKPVKTVESIKTVEISNEAQTEVTNYINSLSKHETQTLEIAKAHLGSSFSITKSIGFLEWKSKQKH
jgi:hypothetical protein